MATAVKECHTKESRHPEGHRELLPVGKLACSTVHFRTVTLAAQPFNLVQLELDNAFEAFFFFYRYYPYIHKNTFLSYCTSLWEIKESKKCILKKHRIPLIERVIPGAFLASHSNARCLSLIPGGGAKIPHAWKPKKPKHKREAVL